MIVIENNTDPNFAEIRTIANEVWPITYGNILSKSQLDYMMEMMYSVASLQEQANEKKYCFILAKENNVSVGFAAYEIDFGETSKTKIHKIYILSTQQGKGIGKILIDFIAKEAQANANSALILNVNKYNQAIHFYKKNGFVIIEEVVIDIGQGFVMDDFIMEKIL